MAKHILRKCLVLVPVLVLPNIANNSEDQPTCRPRRRAEHLLGVLPPKVDGEHLDGLETFRKVLEEDVVRGSDRSDEVFVCTREHSGSEDFSSPHGDSSSSSGRRLLTTTLQVVQDQKNIYGPAAAESMDFVYRGGPIVQAFAGMGVTGPSVDGGNPNYTFLGAPVTISSNDLNGNLLLGDELQHKIQELVDMRPGWNTTTIVDGRSWTNVTDAGREIEVTMRTPSSVAYDGGDVYFTDYDNSRIFVKSQSNSNFTSSLAVIANVAGIGGMSGDCGPATLGRLRMPLGLTVIPARDSTMTRLLAFSDSGNNRVRTLELTDWPFCTIGSNDCSSDSGNLAMLIDKDTGKTCTTTGGCGFSTTSPDDCAFRCRQLGATSYPIPNPARDITLSSSEIQTLMTGCDQTDGSTSAYLLACLAGLEGNQSEQKRQSQENNLPHHVRTYILAKEFSYSGGVIAISEKIQGVVLGRGDSTPDGRLLRLNRSQLIQTTQISKSLEFRISNEQPLVCQRWGWSQTSVVNFSIMARTGTCYMFSDANACQGGATTDVTKMSGSPDCRPGKITTLVGGGDPGLPAFPSASGQAFVQHPKAIRLAKPQSLLLTNSGQEGEMLHPDIPAMTLVISDTGHHRILGFPLIKHRNFKARLWLFMSGPKAAYTAETMWKENGYQNWVVYWALGQAIGWQNDFNIVKVDELTRDQNFTATQAGRDGFIPPLPQNMPADCDPEMKPVYAADQSKEFEKLGKTVCAVRVCAADMNYTANGFASQDCCKAFCEQTYSVCGQKIGLWPAALSSVQKCYALSQIQDCYVNMTVAANTGNCASGVSAGMVQSNVFLNNILGVPLTETGQPDSYDVYKTLTDVCTDINSGAVNATGCGGWCDLKIADVLNIRRGWHIENVSDTSTPIYAALVEIATFSNQDWHTFGHSLNEMKIQELTSQDADGNYTSNLANASMKFGVGRRARLQMTLDYGLETYYGFPPDSVRLSISSPAWYESTNRNDFMTEGTDRSDLVYWLSGYSGRGKKVGGLTEYDHPTGLAIDKSQRLYIADSNNYRILRMQNLWTNEFTVPIIGTGYKANNGDGEFATQTALLYPRGLTVNSAGVLHVSDPQSHAIRQLLGENWNVPCGYSKTYWATLTNPTGNDLEKIRQQLNCRISQVQSTILYQIERCQQCWNGTLNCSKHGRDMKSSLCATQAWYRRPLADKLAKLEPNGPPYGYLQEPPNCTGCGDVWGCQHPQSNYSWNASMTEDDPDYDPNATYQMTFWLSDAAIQDSIDTLDALRSFADSASLDWSGSGLDTLLNQALQSVGSVDLNTKVGNLEQFLLNRTTNSSIMMAYYKMWHWYQNIVDVCIRVVDSKDVDGRAIIGAQYYDRMSEVVTRTFWSRLDTTTGTWSHSSAYPKCNFIHPRMFGYEAWMSLPFDDRKQTTSSIFSLGAARMLHEESIKHRCCNVNSYICGAGEGPCSLNIDCGPGLSCGFKNCLWSSDENCCMPLDARHAFSKVRIFANKVGYRNLAVDR